MEGVRTTIIGRPRPLSRQRRADPDYTLNCEEPAWLFAVEGVVGGLEPPVSSWPRVM